MAACSEARLAALVRLAALLWISLLAAGAHALIPVGTPAYLNGSVGDLTVQRGLAYAVGRDGLEILDASSPERGYTTLGTLPGAYDHIEVRGDVAYLTSNFGLHIVDVSDPVSPIEVGFLPEAGVRESYALDVAGRFVLLARGAPTSRVGLRIVDVGDPAAPVARGELSGMELPISTFPFNSELSVVHEGHYAFVVHSIGGVAVVDIANPDAPTLVTTFAFSGTGSVGGVALQRGSLFLPGENASEESELLIYDVTDPAAPAPRAPIENLFCARLAVARGIAYCAQSFPYPFGGIALRLFDVSDPASPTGLGLLLLDGFVNALAIADGFAHVVAISAGSVGPRSLQAVDVRVPELPAHALTQEAPYAALALEGTRLYGVGLDRFDVLDVAVPLAPSLLGSVSLRALQFGDVEIFGGTAYVTTSAGIAVLDVSDAAHPRIVTTLTRPVAELASEFARAGNTLYVATFGGRIDIYDIGTTPAAPRLLGSLALADRSAPHDLDLQGERLYVTSVRGLSILDVADATAPREIGRIESPSPAPYPGFGQAGISRDVLYLNEQPFGLGLSIFDVSDPAQPIRVGSLAPSDFDLEVVGERLFLGVSRIYDISDPSSPAPLGALPVDLAGDVVVAGSVAYGTSDFGRALIVTDFGPEYLPPLAVDIDVKPGDPHNRVLLGRPRVLPVALFGSASLDVRDVDRHALALGPDDAPALLSVPALVNRDRKKDLLSLYWTPDTGIAFGDTEVCLTGRLESGRRLRGCDAILTHTGCGRGYETALVVPLCVPLARAARRLRRARSHSGV